MMSGKEKKAVANLKKLLELDPKNKYAEEKLKDLKS
jgi:hypothetical protein